MAIDFPTSPSLNATHSHNGLIWKWDGTSWILQTTIQSGVTQIPPMVNVADYGALPSASGAANRTGIEKYRIA